MEPKLMGRRERNKMLKRERIVTSARALFRLHGYEVTTTREIAEAADVAAGTLFSYARDKRDIILMILNDELEAALLDAPVRDKEEPADVRLAQVFQPSYEFFARERIISLAGLREIATIGHPQADDSSEVERLHKRRERTRLYVAEILKATFDDNAEARSDRWLTHALDIIMSIQSSNVRLWLHGDAPTAKHGLERLREQFLMLIEGLRPRT
jgi:AcrR family transcriptional regulator